jgi:hypothetical protein
MFGLVGHEKLQVFQKSTKKPVYLGKGEALTAPFKAFLQLHEAKCMASLLVQIVFLCPPEKASVTRSSKTMPSIGGLEP